ncbi:MAG: leucine--tRNA ligase [Planctomycetota bacterium]|jgi:leucyl-tRNA synthetase
MSEISHRYDAKKAGEIETRWQAVWAERGTFRQPNPGEPGFDADAPAFYCLDMFPYPSAAGLHVGHPEGYTGTDIISRYRRMKGFNVLHPMGWDAFGLPAEQYAIATGVHPAITTKKAIENYRRQLARFGFSYDWSREFGTIDEDYYRWTQWIFLRIFHAWFDPQEKRAREIGELVSELEQGHAAVGPDHALLRFDHEHTSDLPDGARMWDALDAAEQGAFIDANRLAYVGEQTVNWCPKLGTVLANEEVIDGRSERGGHPVLRKPLRQWLFRITAYADRLVDDLADLDWPESTKTMQAEWIGRSEGAEIDFPLVSPPETAPRALRVYTTRPDTIFGATYMVVAPEHPLVGVIIDRPGKRTDVDALRGYVEQARNRSDIERQENKEKTGVFTGAFATNPATGATIPIWVADYVLMGYGHGAIMAVPGQDQRDWDFAKAFDLDIVRTVQPPEDFEGEAYVGEGAAINSGFLDGLEVDAAKARTIEWLETERIGSKKINYRLRDWLFSRQRYWGEPFPIAWDEDGRPHGVGYDHLPVVLPELEDYHPEESDDPVPLLAKAKDWVYTTAGEAGVPDLPADAPVRRETNTMPGWAGSCWYHLRYCDPKNSERLVGREADAYWMGASGVDLYIGGAEHAVLHLLYARFWHKVLYDLGEVMSPEPYRRLFHQGMITSHAYQRADKGLVAIDLVEEDGHGTATEIATGETVTRIIAKMSKSLKNVVNPDDIIEQFGADTFRLYEMYMGPLADSKPWNTDDTIGLFRFLQRVWRMAVDRDTGALRVSDTADPAIEKKLHRTIAKVEYDIERLAFNTAIAAMIEFVNAAGAGVTSDQLNRFLRCLSPFAPHICEELWSMLHAGELGQEECVSVAPWPEIDEAMLKDDEVEIVVQVLGKVRGRITVAADASNEAIEEAARADERIAAMLGGKTVRKVIVVPGRLVNFVAN